MPLLILKSEVDRYGDDQSVIGYRQGRKAVILEKLRGKSTTFVAERVFYWAEKEQPDVVIVDCDGLGVGTYDHLEARGFKDAYKLYEFHGSGAPRDGKKYYNKRAEIWGELRDWLALPGVDIPDDPELADDLIGPLYSYRDGTILLEKKEAMKDRGLASPDCGDMLAMTFAEKILKRRKMAMKPFPLSSPAS